MVENWNQYKTKKNVKKNTKKKKKNQWETIN